MPWPETDAVAFVIVRVRARCLTSIFRAGRNGRQVIEFSMGGVGSFREVEVQLLDTPIGAASMSLERLLTR